MVLWVPTPKLSQVKAGTQHEEGQRTTPSSHHPHTIYYHMFWKSCLFTPPFPYLIPIASQAVIALLCAIKFVSKPVARSDAVQTKALAGTV